MKLVAALGLLLLASCASGPKPMDFAAAQAMLDQVAAKHSDLVRLTIHAVPTGEDRARVVASNVAAKLNQWSDPEDLEAMKTGQAVTLMEGANLDYTVPVMKNGKAIAAVGVTVEGANKEEMTASAFSIAMELSRAIQGADPLPW